MEEILKLKHISDEISALPEKYCAVSGCFRGAIHSTKRTKKLKVDHGCRPETLWPLRTSVFFVKRILRF
jgi:hypothetical protein